MILSILLYMHSFFSKENSIKEAPIMEDPREFDMDEYLYHKNKENMNNKENDKNQENNENKENKENKENNENKDNKENEDNKENIDKKNVNEEN